MNGPPALSSRTIFLMAGALAASAGLAVLYAFDPATSGFYPVCALHQLTGLQCPGCGGLRAVHQLLHGHLAAAWRLNPLVVVLLPAGLGLGLEEWARPGAGRARSGPAVWLIFASAAAAGLAVFGVLRNLR